MSRRAYEQVSVRESRYDKAPPKLVCAAQLPRGGAGWKFRYPS